MKRIDHIHTMTVEEIAKLIRKAENLELDAYCKSDCEWSNTMENDVDENECLKCCIKWLNEEMEEKP